MKRILLKNSISGIIQLILTTILTFLTIPIFIKLLGSEKYGIFSVVSVIGNLNVFSNLGLNTTLTKYIAEQGKSKQSDYDIWVTLILLNVTILPLSAISIIFSKFIIVQLLNIPAEYYKESYNLFLSLIAANYLLLISQCFVSVINALQKMYISNTFRMLYTIMYWGFILFTLYLGNSLSAIGISILSAAIIYIIVIVVTFYKLWGLPTINGLFNNLRQTAKKQFSYSMQIYGSRLLAFFFNPLTKILLSNFVGLKEVGYYDIALRVNNTALRVLTKPMEALFPMQAQIKDHNKTKLLVHDIEQKSFFFIMPFIIAFAFVLKPLMYLWLGNENSQIVIGTTWISIFYLIGLTTTPNYQFLYAKGLAGKTVIMQTFNVLVNLAVFLFTFRILGFYAAVFSNCAAIFTSFVLNLYYQNKYLGSLIFDSKNQFIRFLGATFTILILLSGMYFSFLQFRNNITQIAGVFFTIVIATIISYRLFHIFTELDALRYFSFNKRIEIIFKRIMIS